jgi:hypothetical protein
VPTHPRAPGAGQWGNRAPTPTAKSWSPVECQTATSAYPSTRLTAPRRPVCWWWRRPRCCIQVCRSRTAPRCTSC